VAFEDHVIGVGFTKAVPKHLDGVRQRLAQGVEVFGVNPVARP
jgi:hypothetical protein